MKMKRRLLSLLLAVTVLAGIAVMAVSADGAVKITNIGSTGSLSGIPSVVPTENITYLSDIYNTSAKVYSYVVPGGNGQVRDFSLDQNFFGTRVYVYTAANGNSYFAVTQGAANLDAEGYRTLNNGVKVHYSDIVLGVNTTIFDKGLSFQPSPAVSADQATVIFDISDLDADYFYAVAGMTGEGNRNTYSDRKLTYEVYGSKDTAYSASGMTFEKLAYAEGIRAWLMGEFNIPVSGYNYLKLVAVSTGTSTASAESVWADACVYKLPTTTADVSIFWDDTYNPTQIRPEGDLTVQLFADGVAVEGKTAVLNAANQWKATFTGLDQYQDDLSTKIVYTAALTEDPALHRLISSENGVITYQYDATLTTKDIPVSLVWDDANANKSLRPEEIVVQLYADGEAVTGKTVTLNADNEWKATFAKLAEKKRISAAETTDIVYTFKVLTRSNNYTAKITDNEGSIVVTMTYASSNATEFPTIGKSGTLEGIPAEATGANTHYLTDMLNGRNKRVTSQYIADGGKYKSFENYEGQVQVIYGSGTKQQLVTDPNTVVNGVTYQPTDIVLGANGTVYSEGLSFMASAPSEDDTYITYNLSGMNATNFYAVVGITGTANDLISKDCYLTFEVWGSKDGTTYEKLGYADEIRSYLLAEFNVDITGYNYLKLTAYNTGVSGVGASAVWADALVYTSISGSTPTEPTDPTEPDDSDDLTDSGDVDTSTPIAYTASTDGSYTGITKAAKDSCVELSDAKYVGDSYILPSSTNPNRTVRIDTTDLNNDNASDAVIGKANANFSQHLTLHPTEKTDKTYAFVELDLTGLDVDRFYAAVGISASAGKSGNKGVIFNVFGYDEAKKDYVLIGTSSDVHGYESGEFNIDITGYKKLKLEVALTADSTDHYSRTSSWCDVAVYKYDENGSAPESPDEGDDELPGVYTSSSDGSYKWISDAKNGAVTYLSKLVYTSSSNSSAGNPTTKNEPYGESGKKIIIGQKNTGFTYGLGVHPKSGTAEAYTIYDLSNVDADRFYSAVGITNEKGKSGSSKGVIFKVYVDYQGNGTYKQLAESEIITNKKSGEFHVDITGVKSLKLVVNSATGDHASSASAWAAACVYKYDPNGSRPTSYTTVGASNSSSDDKTDNTGLKPTAGFTPSVDGEYSGVDQKHIRSIIYLSDLQYLESSNTTSSAYPNGQPTTLDHPYNTLTDLIIIGEKDRAFFEGLGVHPKNPSAPVNDSIQSWTTYDVSNLNADRFYAAVGITNDKGKEGASKGVIFRVYADYDGNGNYKLLAHSGCLDGRDSGEFDLDITGVKTLKLTVEAASSTHASSASAWANACVYDSKSIYEGVGKPEIKDPSTKPGTTEPAEPTESVEETIPAQESTGKSAGLVIGIAAICVIGLLAIILVILLVRKSRRSRKHK